MASGYVNYSKLPNTILLSDGQPAWKLNDLPSVMSCIAENGWIVLGGDVLTCNGKYTHDNWYYDPDTSLNIADNVRNSISKCLDYTTEYVNRNGSDFLFVLVLSNKFLQG